MSEEKGWELKSWIREYETTLKSRGYAAGTLVRRRRHLECLERFLEQQGRVSLEAFRLEQVPQFVDYWVRHCPFARASQAFQEKRPGARYYCAVKESVRSFLRWARGVGHLEHDLFGASPLDRPCFFPEVRQYLAFCREHKGLAESTLKNIESLLRRFDHFLCEQDVDDWHQLRSQHLDGFLRWQLPAVPIDRQARARHLRRIQSIQSILRGFLGYLFSLGRVDRDWAFALRSPRRHRLASTPRALSARQVLGLLESVDRGHPPGKRDFALLLLAASLGLRSSEMAALRLEHLHWRWQMVYVEQPKTDHFLCLPLSRPLIEALSDYLREERPKQTPDREVFLHPDPSRGPLKAHAISALIAKRMRQAGLVATAHQLRHAFAGELLRTGIAFSTLQELLGHRHLTSTQVYTKIDLVQLRDVAENDAQDY